MDKSSEKAPSLFDAWFQSQADYMEKWTETAANFQKSFPAADFPKSMGKDPQELFSVYNAWRDTVGKYIDVIVKNQSLNTSRDTISKLFSGADAYIKLYEFWAPLLKAFQAKGMEAVSYENLWDPAKYRDMINKVFGFGSPESLVEFYGQASKLLETWGSKAGFLVKPWSDAVEKNMDAVLDLASGDSEAGVNIFHNIYAAFENTFGKTFKMPAVGKDRETIEVFLKTMDRYLVFLAKNTEFQQTIYLTGEKAMEKVVGAMAERVKANEEITSFDEFFMLWTSVSEKDFLRLFDTDEFSKLQAMVLDAGLEARRSFHQLMELFLSDFPIALRSEMDDVYKTVYYMRRDVRQLKKISAQADGMREEINELKKQVRLLQSKKSSGATAAKKTKGTSRGKVNSPGVAAKRKARKEVTG
jgi:polyhydroxyalkanoate synthesis regulator phasin